MSGSGSLSVAAALTALVCTCAQAASFAQEAATPTLSVVAVESTREDVQGVATSASEGVVTSRQLQTRPLQRAGDIMEVVPGLVATQHAGEGKANQYFLRGFNLDHGTDFATYVDAVPVNLPTHGHGHGYTDLYFLIPELVDSVAYRKGPYYAEQGDFAAVGSARIRTVRKLPRPFGLMEAGSFGRRRTLAAGSMPTGAGDLLLAAERVRDDGPWTVPERLHNAKLMAKHSSGSAENGLVLALTHYDASWTSTDQVPQRAIDSGRVDRFGSLDPTSGGRTQRTGVNASWTLMTGDVRSRLDVYALRYRFDLFSNFTYFTRGCDSDPVPAPCDGSAGLDQFEQVDRRNVTGLAASQQRTTDFAGRPVVMSYGVDLRHDDIGQVGLFDTAQRQRLATVRVDEVKLAAVGLWGQADVQLDPHWRFASGLRWDHRDIDVASSVAANSGSRRASIASPKLSVVYSPSERTDLYANWGRGFHSNDARGTVARVDPRDGTTPVEPATPLVRAIGYEVGTRQKWTDSLSTTAALWVLQMESELLFVGDAGTTEPSRPSRRHGLELTANWRPASGWELDADLAVNHARFRDLDPAGDRIPGAMNRVGTLGLTWQQGPWTVGARVRHFGSHPLIEDDSIRARASTLLNVRIARRIRQAAEVSLDVFNLFDREVDDVAYAYASRLPGEPAFTVGTPATLHVHPSSPRTVRLALKLFF